jgi:hypothetical protein
MRRIERVSSSLLAAREGRRTNPSHRLERKERSKLQKRPDDVARSLHGLRGTFNPGGIHMSTPHREQLGPHHSSRTRWLVGAGIAIAVLIVVVLFAVYSGGGSGPGY